MNQINSLEQKRIFHKAWVLLLWCFYVWGCGGGTDGNRRSVAGVVLLDGEPLKIGSILFDPANSESGTAVGGSIHEGWFKIDRSEGPEPGRYRVRIYASSGIQAPLPKGASARKPRPMIELIPDRYNTQTELESLVTDSGSNTFHYDLIGK